MFNWTGNAWLYMTAGMSSGCDGLCPSDVALDEIKVAGQANMRRLGTHTKRFRFAARAYLFCTSATSFKEQLEMKGGEAPDM